MSLKKEIERNIAEDYERTAKFWAQMAEAAVAPILGPDYVIGEPRYGVLRPDAEAELRPARKESADE